MLGIKKIRHQPRPNQNTFYRETEASGERTWFLILFNGNVLVHETSRRVGAHQRIHQLRAENKRSSVHGSSHRPTPTHVLCDLRDNARVKGQTRVPARLRKQGVEKALPSGWPSQRTG